MNTSWTTLSMVGIGSGAFGYLNGRTYANTFSIPQYIAAVTAGGLGINAQRQYTRYQQLQYDFMMGLFGLSLAKANWRKIWPGFRPHALERTAGHEMVGSDQGRRAILSPDDKGCITGW